MLAVEVGAGAALVSLAQSPRIAAAVAVFAASLVVLFAVSAPLMAKPAATPQLKVLPVTCASSATSMDVLPVEIPAGAHICVREPFGMPPNS